jgi:outer membrane lipoprotein carrier protein
LFKTIIIFLITISLNAIQINIKPFEANFTQTVTNINKKSISYKGNIYFNNDKNVLWKYLTPTIKNIYITKNKLIIEEPNLEQAIYTTIDDKLNLTKLLNNVTKISNNIYQTTVNDIKYTMIIDTNKIKQINYKDPLDNLIKIDFFNIQNNPKFSKNLFIFKPQNNYDIIYK